MSNVEAIEKLFEDGESMIQLVALRELGPSDTLVFKADEILPERELQAIADSLKANLPRVFEKGSVPKVLILEGGRELEVIRGDDSDLRARVAMLERRVRGICDLLEEGVAKIEKTLTDDG